MPFRRVSSSSSVPIAEDGDRRDEAGRCWSSFMPNVDRAAVDETSSHSCCFTVHSGMGCPNCDHLATAMANSDSKFNSQKLMRMSWINFRVAGSATSAVDRSPNPPRIACRRGGRCIFSRHSCGLFYLRMAVMPGSGDTASFAEIERDSSPTI